MTKTPTVIVVDDDPLIREALGRLMPGYSYGEIVAISQRGTFIGDRGIIHDPATRVALRGRRWTTKA
jgi:hypothetical protein